jgi:hypothetical protein
LVELRLGPWESAILVFRRKASAAPSPPARRPIERLRLTNPWTIRLAGATEEWPVLQDWSRLERYRSFSGIAVYRTTLDLLADVPREAMLRLGEVRESAEVLVNGKRAGFAIARPYEVGVTGLLRPGRNEIEIRVANLWNNHVMDMPYVRGTVPGPGYGITEALYGGRDRQRMPSGLLGPVTVAW